MIADIASYSPTAVQVLAIIAAALFALAAVAHYLRAVYNPGLIAAGLCVLALAVVFLV